MFCSAVVIGFVQTEFEVMESDSGVGLELALLEGTIAPELDDIIVTVSTADRTATGKSVYTLTCKILCVRLVGERWRRCKGGRDRGRRREGGREGEWMEGEWMEGEERERGEGEREESRERGMEGMSRRGIQGNPYLPSNI